MNELAWEYISKTMKLSPVGLSFFILQIRASMWSWSLRTAQVNLLETLEGVKTQILYLPSHEPGSERGAFSIFHKGTI